MNYAKLQKLKEKFYFSSKDLQNLLDIKPDSAKVMCSRYVKTGFFVRLKNNFYVLNERWENFNRRDYLAIANILQVPSYISFTTALSVYELTTQVQQNFYENACLRRSLKTSIQGVKFNYYKLKKEYYFDFVKKDGCFMASAEKAFVDAAYLFSFGKYNLDVSSLDLKKLDKKRLKKIITIFPFKTRVMVKQLCKI
jgi:predicted transcriptional regulator of viral defense system